MATTTLLVPLPGTTGVRLTVEAGGAPLSWRQVAVDLAAGGDVGGAWTAALASLPYPGAFWECLPASARTVDQPFEAVVLDSAAVGGLRTDARPFRQALRGVDPVGVHTMTNLGGDAVLVVPAGSGSPASHAHLLAFLRGGAPEQIAALWQAVGRAVLARWEERPAPVWVSTSGLGVSWLHLRLDDRPKYYSWAAYRRAPG